MRHLGRAMQLQNIAWLIVAGDGAACFKRHAAVAPDGKLKRDDGMGVAEGGIDVAICFSQDSRFRRQLPRVGAGWRCGEHRCLEGLDRKLNQLGCVFGDVCVFREYCSDRLTDIAHDVLCQDQLAVWFQLLEPGQPERDRRNLCDIGMRPNCVHARQRECGGGIDRSYVPVSSRRAHDTHCPLAGKRNIGCEAALAGEERAVLEPWNGTANEFLFGGHERKSAHPFRMSFAAARTALIMF